MSSRMRRVQNANMERRPEVFSADIQMFLTYIKWLQTCHPVYYPVNKEAKMIFYTVECRVCPAQKEHIRWRSLDCVGKSCNVWNTSAVFTPETRIKKLQTRTDSRDVCAESSHERCTFVSDRYADGLSDVTTSLLLWVRMTQQNSVPLPHWIPSFSPDWT